MEMNLMKKKKKKGFTLIELIVVIAILGILAAVAVPRLSGFQRSARIGADISTASSIISAAKTYVADEDLNTDAAVNAVTIGMLVTAKLIDAPGNAQTNSTAFVLTVTGGVADPVYTVTAGAGADNVIAPTPGATFTK